MKSMWKRAQTATEYLIILAVVIIIALIVVGVLGGIPGIGGGAGGSANSAFWQTATVGIESLAIVAGSGNNDTVVLKNNLPNSITVTGLWANTTTSDRDDNSVNIVDEDPAYSTDQTTLASGQTAEFNHPINNCVAGETVTLYFTIEYTNLASGAVYNYSAQNQPYDTTCASS